MPPDSSPKPLRSVMHSTYAFIEVIIVNDGSDRQYKSGIKPYKAEISEINTRAGEQRV